jgi:putative DNA-invertase from lambdoid prophage Rac
LEEFLARVETERVAMYARVSTHDQQTLPMQLEAMRAYAERKGWQIASTVEEIGSGAKTRPRREELLRAARRKEIDVIVVWRLDRWGRSLVDLIATLQELTALKMGYVSLSEALDLTTPCGRAFAGMPGVFAEFERDILRDRVKAGIAQARKEGRPHGRPAKLAAKTQEIRDLARKGLSKSAIAEQLSIGRTSVRRLLGNA